MSCGWGGRLLGAMACPVAKYIGTDPSTKTFDGLLELSKEIGKWSSTEVELYCCGSETFIPDDLVDLCFTSPPYFDVEKYSNEPTQSYMKFPTLAGWLDGFLLQTVRNCHKCLKKNGTLVLNVWPLLDEPTVQVCKLAGFRLERRLRLALKSTVGLGRKAKKDVQWKYEPVLVFRKR